MQVKVLFFGKLGEIPGARDLQVYNVFSTDELLKKLNQDFPALAQMKFVVAVDKQIVHGDTELHDNTTVALLPPYAGG
jgi:molybdopterin synthase sulfur carrier subunit